MSSGNGKDRKNTWTEDDEPATGLAVVRPGQTRMPTEVTPHAPRVGDGWLDRRRARGLVRSAQLGTETLREAKRYTEAQIALERTAQEQARVYKQQELLPVHYEIDRQEALGKLGTAIAVRERVQDDLERQRRHSLYEEENDRLRQEVEQLRLRAERREQEAYLERAADVGDRSVDVVLARLDAQRHRYLDETDERRAVMRERAAPPPAPEPPPAEGDPIPEEYARRLANEENVGRIVRQGDRDLAEIESRRVAEGRTHYTPDELERIDAIKNAMDAASGDVRRGGASDVRRRKGG